MKESIRRYVNLRARVAEDMPALHQRFCPAKVESLPARWRKRQHWSKRKNCGRRGRITLNRVLLSGLDATSTVPP